MHAKDANSGAGTNSEYSSAELMVVDEMRSRINLARAVLAARLDRGLTQDALGRAAGTKQSRVSEIESLKGNPRLDTVDRLARVLGLEVTLVRRTVSPRIDRAESKPKSGR